MDSNSTCVYMIGIYNQNVTNQRQLKISTMGTRLGKELVGIHSDEEWSNMHAKDNELIGATMMGQLGL